MDWILDDINKLLIILSEIFMLWLCKNKFMFFRNSCRIMKRWYNNTVEICFKFWRNKRKEEYETYSIYVLYMFIRSSLYKFFQINILIYFSQLIIGIVKCSLILVFVLIFVLYIFEDKIFQEWGCLFKGFAHFYLDNQDNFNIVWTGFWMISINYW